MYSAAATERIRNHLGGGKAMTELLLAFAMSLASGLLLYIIKRWWDARDKLMVMDSVPVREWKQRA